MAAIPTRKTPPEARVAATGTGRKPGGNQGGCCLGVLEWIFPEDVGPTEKFDEIDNRLRKASSEIDIVSKDIARVKELSE